MTMLPCFEQSLFGEISSKDLFCMRQAIQQGHEIAEEIIKAYPCFQTPPAKALRQNIRNSSVDYALEEYCSNGRIALQTRYEPNRLHTCSHLELFSNDGLVLTVSSVRKKTDIPRKAYFRKRLAEAADPQCLMFGETSQTKPKYGIITHTYRKLSYDKDSPLVIMTQVGIPDSEVKRWNYLLDLNNVFYSEPELSPEEVSDFRLRIKQKAQKEFALQ